MNPLGSSISMLARYFRFRFFMMLDLHQNTKVNPWYSDVQRTKDKFIHRKGSMWLIIEMYNCLHMVDT